MGARLYPSVIDSARFAWRRRLQSFVAGSVSLLQAFRLPLQIAVLALYAAAPSTSM
jgi:hypothetical protein